jgi:hypothetical protein
MMMIEVAVDTQLWNIYIEHFQPLRSTYEQRAKAT